MEKGGKRHFEGGVETREETMISPCLLKSIRLSIGISSRLHHDKVMLWTALLVAFFGFLRMSEYTASHRGNQTTKVAKLKLGKLL